MATETKKEELPPTKLEIKILVDQNSHRVLFAEVGKDAADFLLGLLHLPLGYITRLVGDRLLSNSIPSIYSSLQSLPDTYLIAPDVDRADLLNPTASSYSVILLENKPKSAVAVGKKAKFYYHCSGTWSHSFLSETKGAPCPICRYAMTVEKKLLQTKEEAAAEKAREEAGGGYMKGVMRYMVMDDLAVVPMSTFSAIDLLHKFHINDVSSLFESVVEVGMEEGMELLKTSLQSTTVLTDVFLAKFEGGVSIDMVDLGADDSTNNA